MGIISLTGFMGSGKTTVGRKLSKLMRMELIDLDSYICQATGRAIPEIFESEGEEAFRRIESSCLEKVLSEMDGIILSLGGGTVLSERNRALLREKSRCYYLKAGPDTIRKHLLGSMTLEEAARKRPVLRSGALEDLLQERGPVYEDAAHYTVETDGREAIDIAQEICLHWKFSPTSPSDASS